MGVSWSVTFQEIDYSLNLQRVVLLGSRGITYLNFSFVRFPRPHRSAAATVHQISFHAPRRFVI
jgi:hypothetical protein